jgi:hypothetical protein
VSRAAGLTLLAVLAALCLGSCGSGADPESTTGGSADAETAGKPPAGASGFRQPGGDNSIPNFGEEAPAGERARAQTTLRSYLAARAGGAWRRACSHLAAPLAKQLDELAAGRGCQTALKGLYASAPGSLPTNPLRGSVASFRIERGRGFVLFYGPGRQTYAMPVVLELGSWKVAQLTPLPLRDPELDSP